MTIQGPQFSKLKEQNRQFEYSSAAGAFGTDPRSYHLQAIAQIFREQGFSGIKVIRAAAHPLTIERHPGFSGKFEKAVRKAGINIESEQYLSDHWYAY